jgi:predicted AlkP superfamily pyrophosphatase or phosphodiesterase
VLVVFPSFVILNSTSKAFIDNSSKSEVISLDTKESVSSGIRGNYKKIIVITWDGTRTRWIKEYSENGILPTIQTMRGEGGETYLGLGNTHCVTDCCLASIETGFGPLENTIIANQFGAGSPKRRIPDGMQTSEQLKAFFGDEFKTGHLNSWQHHEMDEKLFGLPGHILQEEMLDSIFLNAQPGKDVDFWFGSENLSWVPEDIDTHRASWDEYWYGTWIDNVPEEGLLPPRNPTNPNSYGYVERYSTTHGKDVGYWKSPLINAHFLAEKATEFINLYHNNDFYLRIHMTEPDHIGHTYSESSGGKNFNIITPEYLLALKECDNATGKIKQALIDKGISDDTLVIVGADHSFLGTSHCEEPIFYVGNKKVWGCGENNTNSQGLLHNIQPTILALTGVTNWTEICHYNSKLLYDEELVTRYTPPLEESTTQTTTKTSVEGNSSATSSLQTTYQTSYGSYMIIFLTLIWVYKASRNKKRRKY